MTNVRVGCNPSCAGSYLQRGSHFFITVEEYPFLLFALLL